MIFRWRQERSVALFGLALVAIRNSLIYLPLDIAKSETPAAIMVLTSGTPLSLTGWGVLWGVAFLFLFIGAWMRRRWQQWGMGMMVLMLSGTAGAYLYSWVLLFPPNNGEWSNGLLYLGFTIALVAFIRQDKRTKKVIPPRPPTGAVR